MKTTGKAVFLAVLNQSAAAVVGLCVGMFYSHYLDDASDGRDTAVVRQSGDVSGLYAAINSLAAEADARIGVAAIFSNGDTLVWPDAKDDEGQRFPMMSVMKFHQALAVCDCLKRASIPLDAVTDVTAAMLHADTWSPLRDAHPEGGTFTYAELLEYTLVYSDNNACDILFELTGGPVQTADHIASLGIGDFDIECTEAMLHENPGNCIRNWTTPLSAAMLLEYFWRVRDADGYMAFIWDTMCGCRTGEARIPGRIQGNVQAIAHKTGTGDLLPDGRISAVNDAGIIVLPDGSHISLAVFVRDAACSMQECEELIAAIAEAAACHARGVSGHEAVQ